MGLLGSGLVAIAKGRSAHLQGKAVHQERERKQREQEEQARAMVIKMALDQAEKKRQQANTDRTHGLLREQFEHTRSQPRAPVLGTPEYLEAQRGVEGVRNDAALDRERAISAIPRRPGIGRGGSGGGGSDDDGEPSAGAARRASMADKFVDMYLGAYGGSYNKAVNAIKMTPAEMNKAKALGLTDAHWRAGVARHQAKASEGRYE